MTYSLDLRQCVVDYGKAGHSVHEITTLFCIFLTIFDRFNNLPTNDGELGALAGSIRSK